MRKAAGCARLKGREWEWDHSTHPPALRLAVALMVRFRVNVVQWGFNENDVVESPTVKGPAATLPDRP